MKCRFCNREIVPDVVTTLEDWGTIIKTQCPRCFMIFNVELKGLPKSIRRWWKVKEILKEKKLI